MTERDWKTIETRLGLAGAGHYAQREIIPLLEGLPVDSVQKNGERTNRLEAPMSFGFFGFVISFMALHFILPDHFIGVAARFVLFPVLFMACLAGSFYLFRGRLVAALLDGKERFLGRSRAMSKIADDLGLAYIPSPGGAPKGLKLLAKYGWVPKPLKDVAALLDDHGGMDDIVDIARASGVMVNDNAVIGSDETRDRYLADQASHQQIEDGFIGTRSGVPFHAFEWMESVDEAPNIYHLVMVLTAPRRLYGYTQMRTRHIAWPAATSQQDFKPVGVVAPAFEDRFRIRSTDQTEARYLFDPVVLERTVAIAHGEPVRAAAFGNHIVFDVAGEDRFALVDLTTGEWNADRVSTAMVNIADMLDLADALAHAFKLRPVG